MSRHIAYALLATVAAACGSSAPSADPGDGTRTLLVQGSANQEGSTTNLRVYVARAGLPVTDAAVSMESDLGVSGLTHIGAGVYVATAGGWGHFYTVHVNAATDELHGTVVAPDAAFITVPDPTIAFDCRATPTITLAWGGALSDSVRVESDHLSWTGAPDPGTISVANTIFTAASYPVNVRRTNTVQLAGGVAGSQLSARSETRTTLLVANPF